MVSDCVFRLARRVYELFSYFMYDFKNYVLKLRKMFLLPKNVLIQNEQRLWWGTSEFLSWHNDYACVLMQVICGH